MTILFEKNIFGVAKKKLFVSDLKTVGGSGRTRICDLTLISSCVERKNPVIEGFQAITVYITVHIFFI